MSERISSLNQPGVEMTPVFVMGGLMTGKECQILYNPLLDDGVECDLSSKERFFFPPKRGLGKLEETFKVLEEEVLMARQKLGKPAVIVAHSLSAPIAQKIQLENPEVASKIVLAAGVHEGQLFETGTSLMYRHLLGNPEHAKDLKHDSEFMTDHVERVATEWSPDVEMHGVFTPFDDLLPMPHGMKLELPEGQQAERAVITLPLPGLESIFKFVSPNYNIKFLRSWRPALHYDLVRHPEFIKYVRKLQMSTTNRVVEIPEAMTSLPADLQSKIAA